LGLGKAATAAVVWFMVLLPLGRENRVGARSWVGFCAGTTSSDWSWRPAQRADGCLSPLFVHSPVGGLKDEAGDAVVSRQIFRLTW